MNVQQAKSVLLSLYPVSHGLSTCAIQHIPVFRSAFPLLHPGGQALAGKQAAGPCRTRLCLINPKCSRVAAFLGRHRLPCHARWPAPSPFGLRRAGWEGHRAIYQTEPSGPFPLSLPADPTLPLRGMPGRIWHAVSTVWHGGQRRLSHLLSCPWPLKKGRQRGFLVPCCRPLVSLERPSLNTLQCHLTFLRGGWGHPPRKVAL